MMEQLKRYWEIAKLALLQEKAAKDSKNQRYERA